MYLEWLYYKIRWLRCEHNSLIIISYYAAFRSLRFPGGSEGRKNTKQLDVRRKHSRHCCAMTRETIYFTIPFSCTLFTWVCRIIRKIKKIEKYYLVLPIVC